MAAAGAGAHPMPNSTVVLQAAPGSVTLDIAIPISELKAATDGAPAGDVGLYVAKHAGVTGADGRAWRVEARDVRPDTRDGEAVMALTLVCTPSPEGSAKATTLRYDAVNHRIASHFVLIYRTDGERLTPLVRLQAPAAEVALP